MKKLTKILLAGVALSGALDAAAATQSYSVNSNVLASSASGKITGGVLDLTKFNTSLGALQSVQIALFSDLNTTVKVENTSRSSPSNIKATVGTTLNLTGPGVSAVTLTDSGVHTFVEAKFDNLSDFAGTSGGVYTFSGAPYSNSSSYTDLATLALFKGAGTVHFNVTGSATSLVQGISGNTRSLVLPSYDAYATVTYTYALPVPEPETYAMLLAGLGLMGAVLRKRKA